MAARGPQLAQAGRRARGREHRDVEAEPTRAVALGRRQQPGLATRRES